MKKSCLLVLLCLAIIIFAAACSRAESGAQTYATDNTDNYETTDGNGTNPLESSGITETDSNTNAATDSTSSAAAQNQSITENASPTSLSAEILLESDSAVIKGDGVTQSGKDIIISKEGAYRFSGSLSDGRIIVDAKDANVNIILAGAEINCSYSSAVFAYKSASTTITLESGTKNTLSDAGAYIYSDAYSDAESEEPNACVYSKSDLIIDGDGTLTVNGNFANGITGKDTLEIKNSEISVTAANHGINGKDCNIIRACEISVVSGGDALRSTNDTDNTLGYIVLENSTLNLTSGEDSVQAEQNIVITSCDINIKSGRGAEVRPSETISSKGIKAAGKITISSGNFNINSSDDALHSNTNIDISGGVFDISTGDDAFHADDTLTIGGGTITVSKSYEGFEGGSIIISGGSHHITSSDDGINAAGGTDSSGFGPLGGNTGEFTASEYVIKITGGSTVINSAGDGVDSNGDINMSGGTLIVYGPTSSGNGALDYQNNFELSGGFLLSLGSSAMAQAPDNLSQYAISISPDNSLAASTYVSVSSAENTFVFKTQKATQNIVLSSPNIKSGESYTVSYGEYEGGEINDGICTGGTFTKTSRICDITISDYLTTYGKIGMGGTPGNEFVGRPGAGGAFGGEGGRPNFGDMTPPEGIPQMQNGEFTQGDMTATE